MRLVVRCIYYMPVTPSCDVIELDHETWIKFLHSESMIYRINILHLAIRPPGNRHLLRFVDTV